MKISIIGTGYVGLVSGTCFAQLGHHVECIDSNSKKIDDLKQAIIPIYEPGLEDLVIRNIKASRLTFSINYESVEKCDAVILAVGTPPLPNGQADLSSVFSAMKHILHYATKRDKNKKLVVVIKSTVPIGTWRKLEELVDINFISIVSNPEFLKEGTAIDDFMKPDRIVIGFNEKQQWASDLMDEMYEPMVRQGNPILKMSNSTAELAKYASNCFLATKISFINEMSRLCDRVGADIDQLRAGMISDKRIGPYFLYPGVGYGGSCFPKDIQALIYLADSLDVPLSIVKAAQSSNILQKKYIVDLVLRHFSNNLSGLCFAIWGVAFKGNTDDVRESAAHTIVEELIAKGATLQIYDPLASLNFLEGKSPNLLDNIKVCDTKEKALEWVDGLIIITDWSEFKSLELDQLIGLFKQKVIFDGRNLIPPKKAKKAGFSYYGVGRNG